MCPRTCIHVHTHTHTKTLTLIHTYTTHIPHTNIHTYTTDIHTNTHTHMPVGTRPEETFAPPATLNAPGAQPQPQAHWPQSWEESHRFSLFHVVGGAGHGLCRETRLKPSAPPRAPPSPWVSWERGFPEKERVDAGMREAGSWSQLCPLSTQCRHVVGPQ